MMLFFNCSSLSSVLCHHVLGEVQTAKTDTGRHLKELALSWAATWTPFRRWQTERMLATHSCGKVMQCNSSIHAWQGVYLYIYI